MIELKPDWTYVGIWYVGGNGMDFDWQACIFKETNDPADTKTPWKLKYRFRYYDGDQNKNPFECGDTKNWYTATMPDGTEENRIKGKASADASAQLIAAGAGGEIDYIAIDGPWTDGLMFELMAKPWAHPKLKTSSDRKDKP
jgi:hypothetical protein